MRTLSNEPLLRLYACFTYYCSVQFHISKYFLNGYDESISREICHEYRPRLFSHSHNRACHRASGNYDLVLFQCHHSLLHYVGGSNHYHLVFFSCWVIFYQSNDSSCKIDNSHDGNQHNNNASITPRYCAYAKCIGLRL